MKPIGYNFRQAKKEWEQKEEPLPSDVILNVIERTPGAWKKILEQQKQAYLDDQEVIRKEKDGAK